MKSLILFATACMFLFACRDHPENATGPAPLQPLLRLGKPLDMLRAGNQRFVSGHPIHPHETLERIRELKKGQHPFVAIVSCSDSRVPPELIFDQGLGDIFSIRTAGNVIGDYELASIEYAVEELKIKVVMVLGHQDCGAVKAYLADTAHKEVAGHISALIEYIRKEEEEKSLPEDDRKNISIAVYANVLHGMNTLKNSEPYLKPLVDQNKLTVLGGLYNMENGKVVFLEK